VTCFCKHINELGGIMFLDFAQSYNDYKKKYVPETGSVSALR
jgi:hypothetical protein